MAWVEVDLSLEFACTGHFERKSIRSPHLAPGRSLAPERLPALARPRALARPWALAPLGDRPSLSTRAVSQRTRQQSSRLLTESARQLASQHSTSI